MESPGEYVYTSKCGRFTIRKQTYDLPIHSVDYAITDLATGKTERCETQYQIDYDEAERTCARWCKELQARLARAKQILADDGDGCPDNCLID